MRESIGKNVARKIFFEEVLPNGLSHESLAKGNMLLLLGDEPRELIYTDVAGIPRTNIWSVERVSKIYKRQLRQKLGVHLKFGEMSDFLRSMLSSNQEFLVFNLDIEGSYLSQLDGAMASVFLLCLRNPETLVGMYSSIGRDTEMLWEGIKSLATFLWLSKERTLDTFISLKLRYERAGFTQPVNMAFRDFFWLRSMLEHTLVASSMVGAAAQLLAQRWFVKSDMLWNSIARWKRKPLTLGDLIKMVELATEVDLQKKELILQTPSCLCSSLASCEHLVYHAERPWSQLCYFAKLRVVEEVISCTRWLENGFSLFVSRPLIFVDRDGSRSEFLDHGHFTQEDFGTMLWDDNDLYRSFHPRHLPIYSTSSRLVDVSSISLGAKGAPTFFNKNGYGREVTMAKQFVDRNGNLTDHGKSEVQHYGKRYPDLGVAQILELLPRSARKIPENVIRAHIAVSRRKKKH